MKYLKPKDVARILETTPIKVSKYAKDIESVGIYRFKKTPIGSFLFQKEEIELIKTYMEMSYFFKNKKEISNVLKMQPELFMKKEEKYPEWTKFLSKEVKSKL